MPSPILLTGGTRKIAGVFFILVCGILPGCREKESRTAVDFSETVLATSPQQQLPETDLLRVAISSMVSPRETGAVYLDLLEYIGLCLSRRIERIQGRSYSELNALFNHSQIDLAFIGSGPYATGKEQFGFDALAVPQIGGKTLGQVYLIVGRDRSVQALEDLRGRPFALTDRESFTGSILPGYWLKQMKETPESFFGRIEYTHANDYSILAVNKGMVDGATVNGTIWEYYNTRKPDYTTHTRIIKRSGLFGNPPIVAAKGMPDPLKESIAQILISMHLNPNGTDILRQLMIERFVEPKDVWYDPIRQMAETTHP